MVGAQPIPPFEPIDAEGLRPLLHGPWSFVSPEDPLLGGLQGASLNGYRLLALVGSKNNVGSVYFQAYLVDVKGMIGRDAMAFGLRNAGPYPGYNWVELVRYEPVVRFAGETFDIRQREEEAHFFRFLGALLPPGGHLMVEYDSPSQRETARILTAGYPAACSPLGYALLQAGCRNFRDWYIPEGGREGPRKLQGFKPLNEEASEMRRRQLEAELTPYLVGGSGEEGESLRKTAREFALKALDELRDAYDKTAN